MLFEGHSCCDVYVRDETIDITRVMKRISVTDLFGLRLSYVTFVDHGGIYQYKQHHQLRVSIFAQPPAKTTSSSNEVVSILIQPSWSSQ